ncbi:tetratricopeptide repeat protein [Tropicimonas sp.]|uniref:tetratricopeptide repeat protein n=1 Tax=Tropicimonas sp. TaxID=2067044 RepID=UPI003A8C1364
MPSFPSLRLFVALGLALSFPAVAQDPGPGFSGAYLAARHAGAENDYRAAADYYTRALARDRDNPSLQESALLANMGLGEFEAARPVARQMQGLGFDSQIANMALLVGALNDEEYQTVIDGIDGDLSVGPLVDGLIRGWSLVGAGQVEAGMAAFDEASKTTGLTAFGLYHKALALALAGDFEGAEIIFSGDGGAPLRLTRRGAFAHSQVLSQLGRNPAALELIRTGWGTDLDSGLQALADRLAAGEKVPFTQIGSVQDGVAEVFYTVADALEGEAADSYTLIYARAADYLRPGHVDAILLAAGLLEKQKQYDLATEAYNRVPAGDAGFPIAEIGRAAALSDAGKREAAIEVLQNLAKAHGGMPIVQITLGDSLRQADRFDEASKAYDAAIALFDKDEPGQWIVYYARGITHEREKRWDQAEADFRKALDLNPGQPQVLNYLGYSFVEMERNLDEALAMIEQAVREEPDSGYIIDSLGWAEFRLGRYDDAVINLERAAQLMAVDPVVNDHLGDAYWAVGRRIEARFQWRRALSFNPEPEEAGRIRRKLDIGLDQVLEDEGAEPLAIVDDRG